MIDIAEAVVETDTGDGATFFRTEERPGRDDGPDDRQLLRRPRGRAGRHTSGHRRYRPATRRSLAKRDLGCPASSPCHPWNLRQRMIDSGCAVMGRQYLVTLISSAMRVGPRSDWTTSPMPTPEIIAGLAFVAAIGLVVRVRGGWRGRR